MKLVFALAFITTFFQINLLVFQDTLWGGHFNPYTSLQWYIADFFFFACLFLYGLHILHNSKRVFVAFSNSYVKLIVFGMLFFVTLSYFFSIRTSVTFIWIIQIIKLLVVYFLTINRVLSEKTILHLFIASLIFQTLIAIIQFALQSSIGLSLLGESRLSPETLNVAKLSLGGFKILRAYGTQTHANILGGLLSLGIISTIYLYITEEVRKRTAVSLLIILGLGLFLSFSRSAWLATAVSITLFLAFRKYKIEYARIQKIIAGILITILLSTITGLLPFVWYRYLSSTSAGERVNQVYSSAHMMLENPFGVGMGNFTNAADLYSNVKLMPWEFEPVHNVYLLIGTELGVLAMAIALFFTAQLFLRLFSSLKEVQGKYKCLPVYFGIIAFSHVFILMNFDHYFYTSFTARTILIVFFGILTNLLRQTSESGLTLENRNTCG